MTLTIGAATVGQQYRTSAREPPLSYRWPEDRRPRLPRRTSCCPCRSSSRPRGRYEGPTAPRGSGPCTSTQERRQCDGDQDADHQNDHHQLDEGKAVLILLALEIALEHLRQLPSLDRGAPVRRTLWVRFSAAAASGLRTWDSSIHEYPGTGRRGYQPAAAGDVAAAFAAAHVAVQFAGVAVFPYLVPATPSRITKHCLRSTSEPRRIESPSRPR